MKTSPAPLLLCLLLVLMSCRKEEVPVPVEQMIPLRAGNEWVYKVTDYDSNGKIMSTSESRTVVMRDTVINGGTWYILNGKSIVQNTRNGYAYFNKNNRPGDEAVLIYPNASHGGIGYVYQYPNYTLWVRTRSTYQLAPIEDALENLTGYTFVIRKEHSQPGSTAPFTFKQNDYVSPKVGLVRSDRFFVDSDVLMRRVELVRYTLK